MSGLTAPYFYQKFFAPNGTPLAGGSLLFLVAGSTNLPKNVYVDYSMTIPYTSPLVLDASGVAPQYFLETGLYKIVLRDSTGVVIDTFDYVEGVASGGGTVDDHKVMVDSSDTLPEYLSDKVVTSATVDVMVQDAGAGRKVIKLNVNESAISHPPTGPAGGDLFGTYPDPGVKQLTGVSAAIVAKTPGFSYPTNPAMTGIGFGYTYINGVSTKAWGAISYTGHIRWSIDNWATSLEDDGLFSKGTSFGVNWNAFSYIKSGNDWYWVAGDGANQAFYMAKHIPANYTSEGKIKAEAWVKNQYPSADYISNRLLPPNVGDIAHANGVTCWVGNSTYVGRTTDFNTFTSPSIDAYMNTGGIATDGYDTWMIVTRDTGDLYRSVGNQAMSWSKIDTVYIDGVAQPSLPMLHGEQWGSILCSYGVWVAVVYAAYTGNTSHISYAYSTDTINWTTVTGSDIVFFSAASNGVSWYATNPKANSTNPVYQLLIAEIPAHKKIICEQGLAVAGDVNFVDIHDAEILCTDQYGKVFAGDVTNLGGKVLVGSSDTVKGFLTDKVGVLPSQGLSETVVTQAPGDEKVLLGSTGEVRVSASDTNWDYLQNKLIPGAGITILPVDAGVDGTKLSINAKGNSWRLLTYVSADYTVVDTDDTIVVRSTLVNVTFPIPSAAYEGRVVTVQSAGTGFTAHILGAVYNAADITNYGSAEIICLNNGSGFFWIQR